MREPVAPARRRVPWTALALAAILLLSAGLRFYRLDGQSFWNDEGTSVALVQRSLGEITRAAAADIHPPLYYYLLAGWVRLWGASEVGARSLSALLGVALVALVYLWGRRLFGRLTGLAAALLVAISSFQVYYAQEARMYMLLAVLGAASSLLFDLAWLEPDRRRPWAILGWMVVTAGALYTQYTAIALLAAQNLTWAAHTIMTLRSPDPVLSSAKAPALISGRARWYPWRRLGIWLGVQAVVAALYLPWLWLTWQQLHTWPGTAQPFGLFALLRQALPLFVVGPFADPRSLLGLAALGLGLVALGALWPGRAGERDPWGRLLALLHWLMPLALIYILSRTRPVYHPKFLLLATPGFALLAARGIAALAGRVGAQDRPSLLRGVRWALSGCALLAILAAGLPGLSNYYTNPRYARDDYRGIARYIEALGGPGDAVLINAPSQVETFAHYYRGPAPVYPLPRQRPPDREQTLRELEALTGTAERIFGVFWATDESDPERLVEGWLDSHAYKALDAWYGNVRLVAYAVPSRHMGEDAQHPLTITFGDQIELTGYSLEPAQVAGGDILQLSLSWRALVPIDRRYKVFTHVIDADGRLVGQRDAEPGGGAHPTDTWQVGEQVLDHYGLPILPGTPPGEYRVEVGLYTAEDARRLPVTAGDGAGGDHVILQAVQIIRPQAPPPLAALDLQRRRAVGLGDDLQVLGCSLGRLGAERTDPPVLHAGEVAELVLFWQALRSGQPEAQALVRIVDAAGRVRLEVTAPPTAGRYPLSQWQAQEIVRDPWHLTLPGDLAPGRYRLLIGLQGSPALSELTAFMVQ